MSSLVENPKGPVFSRRYSYEPGHEETRLDHFASKVTILPQSSECKVTILPQRLVNVK